MLKSFRPLSASVGTSGNNGERLLPVTASALTLPVLASVAAVVMLSTVMAIWPPIRSVITGVAPLYGAWTMSMPRRCSMVSAIR
ncbi:hypothetical protein D9M72_504980 [compost metagenome]